MELSVMDRINMILSDPEKAPMTLPGDPGLDRAFPQGLDLPAEGLVEDFVQGRAVDRINMILSDPEKAPMTLAQIVSEEIREL